MGIFDLFNKWLHTYEIHAMRDLGGDEFSLTFCYIPAFGKAQVRNGKVYRTEKGDWRWVGSRQKVNDRLSGCIEKLPESFFLASDRSTRYNHSGKTRRS